MSRSRTPLALRLNDHTLVEQQSGCPATGTAFPNIARVRFDFTPVISNSVEISFGMDNAS
jgi:hypothetical protein